MTHVSATVFRCPSIFIFATYCAALTTGCIANDQQRPMSAVQQKRLLLLQELGSEASLTIYPIIINENPMKDAANVVALFLEQAGMRNLDTTDDVFRIPVNTSFDDGISQFGDFIAAQDLRTDYALYAAFVGTPTTGPQEVHSAIVDKHGKIVIVDRQSKTDRAFKRAKPHSPMTCCQFLSKRISKQLKIPRSARDTSGQGRIARKLAKESPGPGKQERAAMEKRQATMQNRLKDATISVLPVRLSNDEVDAEAAAGLANQLSQKKLGRAYAIESELHVQLKRWRNEQKTLWELARQLKKYLGTHPVDSDYVLLADYIFGPTPDRVWAVHFVICDRNGDWVVVDFQNEHHRDFQRIDPQTKDDCSRLVVRRLRKLLR